MSPEFVCKLKHLTKDNINARVIHYCHAVAPSSVHKLLGCVINLGFFNRQPDCHFILLNGILMSSVEKMQQNRGGRSDSSANDGACNIKGHSELRSEGLLIGCVLGVVGVSLGLWFLG